MNQLPENWNRKKAEPSSVTNFGKVPPNVSKLEEDVLGAIMLEKDAFDEVSAILKPQCFYSDNNAEIFKAATNLANKNMPIDSRTMVEELSKSGKLESVGGAYAIAKLTNDVVSTANVKYHAMIIFQKFIQRELIKVSSEIIQMAYDAPDAFECLDYAERSIGEIGSNYIDSGMVKIDKVIIETFKKIEEWRNMDTNVTGISSGFSELDRATRGWQPGDLIIVAARPSVGKTAFALNLIKEAATNSDKPISVGVWSLEMKAVHLVLRMLSSESKIILNKIQTGRLSDEEMSDLGKGAGTKLSRLGIFFNDKSKVTIRSITRKARKLKKTDNLGLIVIDYLQLMKGASGGNREREIAEISRELKDLAQELEIPIIALSQLSREMGSKNINWEYGPPISSIRESGSVEQDADVIIMLWGPSDEDINKDSTLFNKRKVRIAKQRNGVLLTEELNFRNEIQLFEKIAEIATPFNFKPVKQANIEQINRYEPNHDEEVELPF